MKQDERIGDGHCPDCAFLEEWCEACPGHHWNDPCEACGTQRYERSFCAHGCSQCNPGGAMGQLKEAAGKNWLTVRSCLRNWPEGLPIGEALDLVDRHIASTPFVGPRPRDRLMLFLSELASEDGPHSEVIRAWIHGH